MHDDIVVPPRKKVLNVGGNDRKIPIPPYFDGWEHLLLDIDPTGAPDILCDARELISLEAAQFDAIYSARGMMLALGCIQALKCDTNKCPVGIATQDSQLIIGLVVEEKDKPKHLLPLR